ncbi:uncharacterized protein LOC144917787 [Branchiostoma floridae x Branchiostoma belcheri]
MTEIKMTSLVKKLQNLELSLKSHRSHKVSYAQALREAIIRTDGFMEAEVLKRLGDLHLQKGKVNKDLVEFEKAVALYAAALLRCIDPDMRETLDHRIGYVEKLSRQLLHGYGPQLTEDYSGKADNNVLRVAQICHKLGRRFNEQTYTEMLVTAIGNSDVLLELEVLKSLGDFYLNKGKTASDISQFSKAQAMYKKALTRCGDPETQQPLHHRISYMEKIKEFATQVAKKQEQEWRVFQLDILGKKTQTVQKDHLKKGESSLAISDLDSAEQHFAAALKMVHVREPTPQQYKREVEPLYKLGEVYSKRGQQTEDGRDFVKAAALYNAAIARSNNIFTSNIITKVKEVEKSFLKCVLDIHCDMSSDDTRKHKEQLKEMRDQIKLEMETIDQQLNPYTHDDDDPCVKEIEAKRAQAVRQLFEKIAQERKDFILLLVEESIGLMGPPPCKYAMMGLGSQATALVTPYSDLEFAILVEEESEGCLVFFRNLTHYLHLKVVNLGETILPAVGIKSINDFYSGDPLDNWFYDSVTPRGFAFDGSMPKASKTPLGRQGTMNESPSELICTPENMVSILQKDATFYLKEGYHLATILRNPCLIAGNQDLIDTYKAITVKLLQADGGKMAQQLAQETLRENSESYNNSKTITARLIDVKKELYRFPAVAVDCMALSSCIIPTTVWKTIEDLESQQVISANNYGFIHCVLGDMVVRGFGESTWQRIVANSGIELGGGTFLMHKVYSDDDTWRLLNAISEQLEISRESVLESMGEHFVRYCIEYGFGSLLRVLGGSLKDFLCNLDSLHEHLASTYPGIRSPSFCCTEGPDDTLFLHYYSERAGLYPIVKGLVRMIAKEFFHVSVACDVVSEERELTSRQGQVVTFSIRHLSCDGGHPGDEKRLSSGTLCPTTSSDPHDLPLSVDTLSDIFPFHVMLDRNLKVVQMGRSLRRLLRGNVTSTELKFQDIFEIIRPKVDSVFSAIVRHLNTIYVVRTAQGIINKEKNCAIQVIEGASSSDSADLEESTLKLKGEMVFVPESDMLLFLCSPRVKDLTEFLRKGLYFSDTPLHDSSRDVLMVNYLRRRERDLLDKIEDVGNQLRKLQGSLSEDKRRTEELLHSILPSNVVQSLVSRSPVEAEAHTVVSILFSDIVQNLVSRSPVEAEAHPVVSILFSDIVQNLVSRSPVEAEAHPVVSILFSDIVNFTGICERVEPMDIVRMLNKLYTSFDVLSKLNELYKVETIGDAYMVAGGIPVQVEDCVMVVPGTACHRGLTLLPGQCLVIALKLTYLSTSWVTPPLPPWQPSSSCPA